MIASLMVLLEFSGAGRSSGASSSETNIWHEANPCFVVVF